MKTHLPHNASSEPNLKLVAVLMRLEVLAAFAAVLVSASVLVGWLMPAVATLLPAGWDVMKANTALGLMLGAISLVLSQPGRRPKQARASTAFAIGLMLIAASALVQHLLGWQTGLEALLAADAASAQPGLMSLQSAAFLLALGFVSLRIGARRKPLSPVVDALTMGLVMFSLIVLAGYCFDAARLVGQSLDTRASPHTLVCMALLTFVAIGRRSETGYFSVLVGIGIGSQIARIVFPFALVLPFLLVLGGQYANWMGWVEMAYASAMTAAGTSFLFFMLLMIAAQRINGLERELRDMSLSDALTGVANRRGFELLGSQAMREAQRNKTPLTVLFADLDGLKHTNDTFGHDAGSAFIVDVAQLLVDTFRGADIVARVGGDEFAVVIHADEAAANRAMARLEHKTHRRNATGKRPYEISFSLGAATSSAARKESFDSLLKRADEVMYEQKKKKKRLRERKVYTQADMPARQNS